jgi:hypothetical protein
MYCLQRDERIKYTGCPISPRPLENSVILEKYGKFKEGKAVANFVFPISSVGNFCLGQAVTPLYSLNHQ